MGPQSSLNGGSVLPRLLIEINLGLILLIYLPILLLVECLGIGDSLAAEIVF